MSGIITVPHRCNRLNGDAATSSRHVQPRRTSPTRLHRRRLQHRPLRSPRQQCDSQGVLKHRNNALLEPREPINFTVISEDNNLYTFDMRNLSCAMQEHRDHVMAVMDVDYSSDGKEFVSASYDKTVRIFNIYSSTSREVYHTKRMQRGVQCGQSVCVHGE